VMGRVLLWATRLEVGSEGVGLALVLMGSKGW